MTLSLKPSLNWLLVFIPITVAMEHDGMPVSAVFFSAALAIIPIARLIVSATEQISTRTGDAIGGLLNATFGNAPELIITPVALRAGYSDMVSGIAHRRDSGQSPARPRRRLSAGRLSLPRPEI